MNTPDPETIWQPASSESEPQAVLKVSVERLLSKLWGGKLSAALEAAQFFYAPEEDDPPLPDAEDELTALFWRLLTSQFPQRPASNGETSRVLLWAVWKVLRLVRETPTAPFVEDLLSVALRPVRKLQAGILTPEVCAALYDFDRGVWTLHLTKPQRWTIQCALQKTIAALPPDEIDVFWQNLQSPNPQVRSAMRLGLTFLRSAHAVPHLVHGLEAVTDHDTRSAIVDCLEEIGDPSALPVLHRQHRLTAQTDWPLSRQIARVIRVIEKQNRDHQHRTLLRPTEPPPAPENTLLRPAADPQNAASDRDRNRETLLRTTAPEEKEEK